jgi:hypothetical protein
MSESPFAGSSTGTTDGCKCERLSEGESILETCPRNSGVDDAGEIEEFCHLPDGGNSAMRSGAELNVFRTVEDGQGIVGASQVAEYAEFGAFRYGIAERLNDPEVFESLGGNDLEAGHGCYIYTQPPRSAIGVARTYFPLKPNPSGNNLLLCSCIYAPTQPQEKERQRENSPPALQIRILETTIPVNSR